MEIETSSEQKEVIETVERIESLAISLIENELKKLGEDIAQKYWHAALLAAGNSISINIIASIASRHKEDSTKALKELTGMYINVLSQDLSKIYIDWSKNDANQETVN